MSDDDTSSGVTPSSQPLTERLRFINHKGHAVFLIDFSHCKAAEILLLLDQVRIDVGRHAPGSVLTLADFTGAEVDKKVATKIKETLVFDRPYVKKSAWVGTESLPQVFYENFKTFSQRDIPAFQSREEALDWLTNESGASH
jgi:hypothetical protein